MNSLKGLMIKCLRQGIFVGTHEIAIELSSQSTIQYMNPLYLFRFSLNPFHSNTSFVHSTWHLSFLFALKNSTCLCLLTLSLYTSNFTLKDILISVMSTLRTQVLKVLLASLFLSFLNFIPSQILSCKINGDC